ncbi:MAG: hypothetical protein M1814_000763 [Vezdaea aestivalis]|nr:MAG: hypothetical protein M1814_000763 [Vezdaea aestivalis]
MSTYISSFVIEPVLRQARRFSRPSRSSSEEVSHTAIAPLSYESHAVAPSDDESAIHEDATMDGIIAEGTRVQELPNPTLMGGATILEGSMVESPTREDDGLDLQLGGPERRSAPESVTSRQGISLSSSSVRSHPRRHSSMVDDDISGNPSFGVPNPFRSQRLGTTPSLPGTGVVHEGNEQSQEPASRRNTGPSQSSTNSRHHRARNGSLPADDGMAKMRQQIIQIQEMDISSLQKAQLMHDVMTEKYMTSNKWIGKNQPPRPHSPSSFHGHERPHTPTPGHPRSTLGGQAPLTPTSMSSHEGEDEGLYRLTVEDLKPTFIPDSTEASDSIDDQTNHVHSSDADSAEQASSLRFGCKHYKRNVKLQCSTCHGCCNSYNTAQLQIISGSRTPTEALPEPHVNAPLLISGAADVADPSESSANVNGTRPRSDETLGVPGAIPVTGRGADEAEYDEEMDFWGGESPRERRERCVQSAESDESDKGFSDEEDDSDDLEDEMDVHSDEEWGEMDLIGHR